MANFTTFLPAIKLTANSNSYTLPIWNLSIAAIPYSGSGQIAQENFDGSITQRIDGWILQCSFSMTPKVTDNPLIGSILNDIEAGGSVVVDFDPVDDPGNKAGTFALSDGSRAIVADFRGHVRNRPISVSLIGTSVLSAIPDWIGAA